MKAWRSFSKPTDWRQKKEKSKDQRSFKSGMLFSRYHRPHHPPPSVIASMQISNKNVRSMPAFASTETQLFQRSGHETSEDLRSACLSFLLLFLAVVADLALRSA